MSAPNSLTRKFAIAQAPGGKKAGKHIPQFSIRFSVEERERLEREAGNLSLTTHIRQKLFGEDAPTSRRPTRKRRQPAVDYVMLGKILGMLGKSELASHLCLLAVAAKSGALPVSEDVEHDLKSACADIREMRFILLKALGVKPEGDQ